MIEHRKIQPLKLTLSDVKTLVFTLNNGRKNDIGICKAFNLDISTMDGKRLTH